MILPDSTILVDYLLAKTSQLLDRLFVYPDRMLENLKLMKGLIFSGQLLLDLTRKGVSREQAYQWVQRNAMRVWSDGEEFKNLVLRDQEILHRMTIAEIETSFNLEHQLRHVDKIFKRVFGD